MRDSAETKIPFVEAEQDAIVARDTQLANATSAYFIAEAMTYEDKIDGLVADYLPPIGIEPWAAREAALAEANYDRAVAAATAMVTRLVQDVQAQRTTANSNATTAAIHANIVAVAQRTLTVGIRAALQLWASAQNLAEGGLRAVHADAPCASNGAGFLFPPQSRGCGGG